MRLSSGVRCDMSGWGSSAITMAVYARARGIRRGYDAGARQAGAPPTTPTSTGRCRNTDGAYAPSAFLLYDDRRRRGIRRWPGCITFYDYYEARLSSWGSHPTPVDRTTAPRRGNVTAPELRRRRRRRDCTTVVVDSPLERCTRGLRQSRRDTTSVVVDDFGMASFVLRDNDRRWTSLDSAVLSDVWRDTGFLPCCWCWCCGILQ